MESATQSTAAVADELQQLKKVLQTKEEEVERVYLEMHKREKTFKRQIDELKADRQRLQDSIGSVQQQQQQHEAKEQASSLQKDHHIGTKHDLVQAEQCRETARDKASPSCHAETQTVSDFLQDGPYSKSERSEASASCQARNQRQNFPAEHPGSVCCNVAGNESPDDIRHEGKVDAAESVVFRQKVPTAFQEPDAAAIVEVSIPPDEQPSVLLDENNMCGSSDNDRARRAMLVDCLHASLLRASELQNNLKLMLEMQTQGIQASVAGTSEACKHGTRSR